MFYLILFNSIYSSSETLQPLLLSTARHHPCHLVSRSLSLISGLKMTLPFVFTFDQVSGLEMSQPNKLIAEPASNAEPKAVDLDKYDKRIVQFQITQLTLASLA